MKYYVTADVHSYYDELMTALTEKGFFEEQTPHKLIICGDLFDRGTQAAKMQAFILELLAKDRVILIRGNHEDLALDLLNKWHLGSYLQAHHHYNGTIDTLLQLTDAAERQLYTDTENIGRRFLQTPYIQTIIPSMLDFYETDHYIFAHGWIPCTPISVASGRMAYTAVDDWRSADWSKARWINGMEAAHCGITEPGKTIVCGHWHCSFGHAVYENDGDEHGVNANYAPYYGKGVIGLDACTARSKKINCIIIED